MQVTGKSEELLHSQQPTNQLTSYVVTNSLAMGPTGVCPSHLFSFFLPELLLDFFLSCYDYPNTFLTASANRPSLVNNNHNPLISYYTHSDAPQECQRHFSYFADRRSTAP